MMNDNSFNEVQKNKKLRPEIHELMKAIGAVKGFGDKYAYYLPKTKRLFSYSKLQSCSFEELIQMVNKKY